jgi:hypothetical protein
MVPGGMQQPRYKRQQYRRQFGDGFNGRRLYHQRYDSRQPDGYFHQRPDWRRGSDPRW